MTFSLIRSLLFRCRPAAIVRLVVPVIVDAVDAQTFRLFPHIGKKIRESSLAEPTGTDSDSPPTVIRVISKIRVGATLNHRPPNAVGLESMLARVSGVPMLECRRPSAFHEETTTRVGFTGTEIRTSNNLDVSTITAAEPGQFVSSPSNFEDQQSAESLIEKVKLCGHLEPILSGVAGRVVQATPSLYFNRNLVLSW